MDYKRTYKYKAWLVLEKIESFINHDVLDNIFDIFLVKSNWDEDTIAYKIWQNTVYRSCKWVNIDLYDYLFPQQEESNLKQ
jgi:hypothetical protein